MKTRFRIESDNWSADGSKITILASRHGKFGFQIFDFASLLPNPRIPDRPRAYYFKSEPADDMLFSGLVGDIHSARDVDEEPAIDCMGIELTPKSGIYFVPHGIIAALCSLLPVYWILRAVLSRRLVVSSICQTCSYDLRATPGRCPECGTVPKTN